jgi:hypothetical protein
MQEENSAVAAFKPMWQNMLSYQRVTNNLCLHGNADLLLMSAEYSFSYT